MTSTARAGSRPSALQSQPASILKPNTSQQKPGTSSFTPATAGRQGTRGTGSVLPTGSRQPTRGQGQTAGENKPASLWDKVKANQSDLAGDKPQQDDLWAKFLVDQNLAPREGTAQTASSQRTRGSQRSYVTGDSQLNSQASQRTSQREEGEDDEEEEEDDESDDYTVYSDYYLPPDYDREEGTPGPRAEIIDSHEACSCFPNRSNKFIGSMLYDKIECKHTGLRGHTQPGVFKFNPYWNENMEIPRKLRKSERKPVKYSYVWGYPHPKFELVSEDEETDEEAEDEEDADEEDEESRHEDQGRSGSAQDEEEEEDDEEDSEYDDSIGEDENDDYVPVTLPKIGYPYSPSLPPSRESFRYSEYSAESPSLPEVPPGRPQFTAQTKRSGLTAVTKFSQTNKTLNQSVQRQETRRTARTQQTRRTEKSKKSSTKREDAIAEEDEDLASSYETRSRRKIVSRQSLPDGPVIVQERKFQGKVFDPVTKQIMLFDIENAPGARFPRGNIEPLYKPPTAEPKVAKKATPASAAAQRTESKKETRTASKASIRSQAREVSPAAAALGNKFIQNLLRSKKGDFYEEDAEER